MATQQIKIFDTSTIEGLRAAERFQARMMNSYNTVHVYAIGLNRVKIVASEPLRRRPSQGIEQVGIKEYDNGTETI